MNMDFTLKLLNDNARSLHGKIIESYLEKADIYTLNEKIRAVQNQNIQKLSDKEIELSIDDILSIKLDGDITVVSYLFEYSLFPVGTRFYRIRKIDTLNMPNEKLKGVSAFWNPPSDCIKNYGRLNKPGESLLYTAFNPYTAICETRLKPGEPFVLCVYEAIKPLRFSWIGGKTDYDFNGIKSKKAIVYMETIRKFLVDEFTRFVPEGQEYLYRVSEYIAKRYYDSPDGNGWRYPSIKNNYEDNICFQAEHIKNNIKLVGALISTLDEADMPKKTTMSIDYVVTGENMDKYYSYESNAYEKCLEKLFGEFKRK